MSRELQRCVAVSGDVVDRVRALQESAAACLRRLAGAEFGDEDVELQRYEKIQSELDGIAYGELLRPTGPGRDVTALELEITWPFAGGTTPRPVLAAGPLPPRDVWQPPTSRHGGGGHVDPVLQRLNAQLQAWIDAAADASLAEPPPVCPDQIKNRALSEALRHFADSRHSAVGPVEAPIRYQDGSEAAPITLAGLDFVEAPTLPAYRSVSVTLMSIRHLEMDVEVDGAWLRNREISVGRLSAQTDAIVYRESRTQLEKLARHEPLILQMYQTGLPPANVGFYRAVIDHHLQRAGHPVVVVPQYWQGAGRYSPGTTWRTAW